MRCKVGDVVMIVGSGAEFAYLRGYVTSITAAFDLQGDHHWTLALMHPSGRPFGAIDSDLFPIRPSEDESVTDVIKEQTCEHQ